MRYPVPLAPRSDPRGIRRACIAALVTWGPIALLSAFQGVALRSNPHESFLLDFGLYGRYLVAVPVLVYARSVIAPLLGGVARHFLESDLIREADLERYEALIASTRRLLLSRWGDAAILVLAYVTTIVRSPTLYPAGTSTWVIPVSGSTAHMSLAGWWRTLVSQPLFLALVGVWLWRLVLWARFIYGLSRMDLRLVAAHPDQLGGLRFTLQPIRGFVFLAFAIGAVAAGSVAQAVLIDGQSLSTFRYLIGAQVLVVVALLAGPYMFWFGPLIRLHGLGIVHYGRLATHLGHAFQQRWLAGDQPAGADALGVQDFSATTDLYSIVANVRNINLLVLDLRDVLALSAVTLLPYVPLVFAVLPLDQIVSFAAKAFV